jgi:multicomponent Na+:H+ antiporter subunit G
VSLAAAVTDWASAVLLLAGTGVITLSVFGAWRLPDVYTKLHASGKATSVGVVLVLAGAVAGTGEGAVLARSLLIVALLVVTAPTGAHAIAQAAHLRSGLSGDAEPGENSAQAEARRGR